jgi:hypothetical protein
MKERIPRFALSVVMVGLPIKTEPCAGDVPQVMYPTMRIDAVIHVGLEWYRTVVKMHAYSVHLVESHISVTKLSVSGALLELIVGKDLKNVKRAERTKCSLIGEEENAEYCVHKFLLEV